MYNCPMTAGIEAKQFGFTTLKELSDLSGFSVRKLYTIHNSNRRGFKTIMLGAWILKGGV